MQNLVVLFLNLLLEVKSASTLLESVSFDITYIDSCLLNLFRGTFKAKYADKGP